MDHGYCSWLGRQEVRDGEYIDVPRPRGLSGLVRSYSEFLGVHIKAGLFPEY